MVKLATIHAGIVSCLERSAFSSGIVNPHPKIMMASPNLDLYYHPTVRGKKKECYDKGAESLHPRTH